MSAPLSPLTSSGENARLRSPASPKSAKGQGNIDEILGTNEYSENTFSSPFKAVVEDTDTSPRGDTIYEDDNAAATPTHEGYQLHVDGEEESQSVQEAPSSPFQFETRDDTVDFQKLREMEASQLVPSEHSTTPQKRSYEHAPDEQGENGDVDSDGRCRKGANRRDENEIDVYADEDASFLSDQRKGTDGVDAGSGQDTGSNSMMEEKHNEGMSTVLHGDDASNDKENDDDLHDSMDDTHLSTFSAVPNADMTSFAKLRGESPAKGMQNFASNSAAPASDALHQSIEPSTPASAKASNRKSTLIDLGTPTGSPTPRRRDPRVLGNPNATPNLLDLDQPTFSPRPRYSMQNARYSPTRRSPLRTVRESTRSPPKASLLDFDLPPAPTPRSIPAVTPRELESLKSGFMSEISSLKATLSGREAEVSSLKQAVTDAERRVGEALEEVRNEAARKDSLELEQAEWQRRGQEMENILREVKADIVEGEQEKTRLSKKVEEAEKSKDQLESRMVELESQLPATRNAPSSNGTSTDGATTTGTSTHQTKTAEETAHEVQDAVEKVARELHTLYKGKHETKVAALKKSYETRWEKRVREAENKLKEVQEENERMRVERENTMASETTKSHNEVSNMMAHVKDEHEAEKRVLEAQIKGLQREMAALRDNSERLRTDLDTERAEKGELVAVVDEWLAMQQSQPAPQAQPQTSERVSTPSVHGSASPEPTWRSSAEPVMEDFRRSVSHSSSGSGIRLPSTSSATGEKKIPKIGVKGARTNGGGKSGIAVFTPGRSGIMGSIERMGRGG